MSGHRPLPTERVSTDPGQRQRMRVPSGLMRYAAAFRAKCVLVAALSSLTLGCEDGIGPFRGVAELTVVSGSSVTDTINATVPDPLVLQVVDGDGRGISGVRVLVESSRGNLPNCRLFCERSHVVIQTYEPRTDADGRVELSYRFGEIATDARLSIAVPTLQLYDTLTLTIQAGTAVLLHGFPSDTTVRTGRSYQVRAETYDRIGNRGSHTVSYSGSNTTLLVSESGIASGLRFGRAFVVARAGSGLDTVWTSVVPEGRIAALNTTWDSTRIHIFDLDGANLSYLRPLSRGFRMTAFSIAWHPSGTRLVYDARRDQVSDLYEIDIATGLSREVPRNDTLDDAYAPSYSPDGNWIYYTGSPPMQEYNLWRIAAGGSTHHLLHSIGRSDIIPRVSLHPDGNRLIYSSGGLHVPFTSTILNLTSSGAHQTPIESKSTAWAPTGDLVASVNAVGQIAVSAPDGGGRRRVGQEGISYSSVAWSPDGEYLVAYINSNSDLHVVETATGTAVPLPLTRKLISPVWMPR